MFPTSEPKPYHYQSLILLITDVSSPCWSMGAGHCPSRLEVQWDFSRRASHASDKTAIRIRALTRVAFAEHLNGRWHLFLTDPLVLLALGGSLEALPGQGSQVEIHEHVAQALQVITATLFCEKLQRSNEWAATKTTLANPQLWRRTWNKRNNQSLFSGRFLWVDKLVESILVEILVGMFIFKS